MNDSSGFSQDESTEGVFVHKMVDGRECIVASLEGTVHEVVKFYRIEEINSSNSPFERITSQELFDVCSGMCKNLNILLKNNELNVDSYYNTVTTYTKYIKKMISPGTMQNLAKAINKGEDKMFSMNKKPNEGRLKGIKFYMEVQDKRPVILFKDESQSQLVFQFYSHENQSERYQAGLQLHNQYDCDTAVICESLCQFLNQLVRVERLTDLSYQAVLACYADFLRNHLEFSELKALVEQTASRRWN